MTKRLFIIAFSAFLFIAGATFASAQNRGKWVDLGTKEVKASSEQDTWHITSARGQFRRIKLTVAKSAIRIGRLQIRYASGQDEDIEVRQNIPAGGSTRNIDVDGRNRFIKEVNVWYETIGPNPRRTARVTLWGLR
jgi:hypothetical protein